MKAARVHALREAPRIDELLARLADGRLSLEIQTFPLHEAPAALAWIAQRGHRGRAVLVPSR
jgi:NADPH2:quinone reductase